VQQFAWCCSITPHTLVFRGGAALPRRLTRTQPLQRQILPSFELSKDYSLCCNRFRVLTPSRAICFERETIFDLLRRGGAHISWLIDQPPAQARQQLSKIGRQGA